MIGRAIKSYFRNMRYLMWIMGILFLAVLIGCYAAGAGFKYTDECFVHIRANPYGTAALISLGIMLLHWVAVSLTAVLSGTKRKTGKNDGTIKETEDIMIKESMKTYWKNMRYFIMVMGILFVILLVSTSFFARGTMESINAVVEQVSEYVETTNLSFAGIGPAVKNGGSFFAELGKILGNFAGLVGTLITGIGVGIIKIIGAAIGFAVIFLIGLFVCHDIVFIMARYDKEDRGFMEAWFEIYVKDILLLLYLFTIIYFLSVPFLKTVGLVLLILFPIAYCFLSLLGEWLAAGRNRPKFTSVITAKNILILFVENIITIVISLVIAALVFLLFGALLGIFIGLSLMILAAASVSLNAQAFLFGDAARVKYISSENREEPVTEN